MQTQIPVSLGDGACSVETMGPSPQEMAKLLSSVGRGHGHALQSSSLPFAWIPLPQYRHKLRGLPDMTSASEGREVVEKRM